MDHYYILVTSEDLIDGMHSSPPRQALSGRHPLSSTRSASHQTQARSSRAAASEGAESPRSSFFGPAPHVFGASAGFGSMGAPDVAGSMALSSIFGSIPGLASDSSMPNPFSPAAHRTLFSQTLPLGASPRAGGIADPQTGGASSGSGRGGGGAPVGSPGRGGVGGVGAREGVAPMNPLEEILQRAFSHVSAESFISEFVRRTHASQSRGNPPASQFAIDSLAVEGDPITDACAICQDEICDKTKCLHMPCKHAFHKHCILRWLGEHNTCPVCRCEIESHCPQYNQANFDKLKGKLGKITISNHEDPSKMEPPSAEHLLFGPPPQGASAPGPTRTLRMTLRMPVGTLSWLSGPETPPTTTRQRASSRPSSSRSSASRGGSVWSGASVPRGVSGGGAGGSLPRREVSRTSPSSDAARPPRSAASAASADTSTPLLPTSNLSHMLPPSSLPGDPSPLSSPSAAFRAVFGRPIVPLHTRRNTSTDSSTPPATPSPAVPSSTRRAGNKRRRTDSGSERDATRQRVDGGAGSTSTSSSGDGGGGAAAGAERGGGQGGDSTPVAGRTRRRANGSGRS